MIERAMHLAQKKWIWGLVGLFALLAPMYLVLPLSQGAFFASPDETANAQVIRQLSWYGRISTPEPLATEFPWMHPRSFVSRGVWLAPVGFIGWPWVLSVFALILGLAAMPVLASLFMVSSAYPMFRLFEREFGFRKAWLATLVAMTVPGMIVFGNRALFPQIAVLGFGLWSMWLLRHLREEKRTWPFAIAGFLVALAFASRPTELLWLFPWLAWASWPLRPTKRQLIACVLGFLLPLLSIGVFAQIAYGGFWKTGYALRDNPAVTDVGAQRAVPLQNENGSASIIFPFGIHPKNALRNVWQYLIVMQWPWMLLLVAAAIFVKEKRRAVPLLCAWTAFVLIAYYGHGLYSDNINGSTTIANSFIRYLLPLGPIIGLAAAYLFRRFERLAIPVTIVLVVFGLWMAFARDAEGILKTRTELMRYGAVRTAAEATFHPTDVILSERSDKIFFPSFRAVSPLPTPEQAAALAQAHPEVQIGLYVRPLAQSQADRWRKAGFEPVELGYFGREKLYLLRSIQR